MFQHGSRNEYTVQQPFAWLKKAVLVVAIAGFIAVIWYAAANRDNLKSEDVNPALVQAPKSPIKERPDAPGGMEVPHQDKQVFDLLEDEDAVEETATEAAPAPAPETPEATEETKEATPAAEKETATAPAEEPTKAPEPTKTPAPSASAKNVTGWGVQLGSFRSRSDAEKAIDIFNKKFSTMLEGLEPTIREAQLSQGTFYRVSFVGLESNEAARNLCTAFKQRNQGCLNVNLK